MGQQQNLIPFLKWPGGKRWLFNNSFVERLPPFERYIEPFLGGGAGFFTLQPRRAILSDINPELINVYRQIRDAPKAIAIGLQQLQERHSKEHYYGVRKLVPKDDLQKAVRTLYLNRTCWNGLYRLNRRGQFNVPIGTKNSVVLKSDNFSAASDILKNAILQVSDFSDTIREAGDGDLVFIDPPYTVSHNNNGFIKYNESIFSWDDQQRLRISAFEARDRGAQVLMTNADHDSVRDLYGSAKRLTSVERSSVLSGTAAFRTKTTELLIEL